MAHQPDDIVSRRHVIFCRKRPMMHRRNDIMHRTADMGYTEERYNASHS